jgi:VIT1/CCC1 family predicted Fe2+/Mn2+ transporter
MPELSPSTDPKLEHRHTREDIQQRLNQTSHGNYLRDWIYGGIDGAVTTFAIVAGVMGAHLSSAVVLVLGLANLVADGFAMGAANYASTKAETDDYQRLLAVEHKHIKLVPSGEREEIRQIFAAKGFEADDLERVVAIICADDDRWANTMAVEEYGLSPTQKSPWLAAINVAAAFTISGLVPLASYLAAHSFPFCVATTGLVFFIIGALKSRWALAGWLRSGLETLAIGMSAAGLAYGVGYALRTFLHVTA